MTKDRTSGIIFSLREREITLLQRAAARFDTLGGSHKKVLNSVFRSSLVSYASCFSKNRIIIKIDKSKMGGA